MLIEDELSKGDEHVSQWKGSNAKSKSIIVKSLSNLQLVHVTHTRNYASPKQNF